MTTQVQHLPSLPKESYNLINPPSQLFKPVPIRKSENSFPISTKTSSPNNHIIYPNFGFGSYSTFNFNSLGNLQNYLLSQEKKVKVDVKNKPCCNCLKTKCMKKYCECFANNKLCKNCVCADCKNKSEEILNENNKENKENIANNNNKENKVVFCTCSKSGCNKKYCDCFKENQKCKIKCRCINCLNVEDNSEKNDSEKGINLDETRCDSGKKSLSGDCNEFFVQKISVCIRKSQTYINVEKLSTDDFSLLCKKRKGDKI